MNKLSSTNKDFNGDNLSKYEFTISLIKECVRCEVLPESFLYTIQEKIGEILKELIIKKFLKIILINVIIILFIFINV